MSYAQYGLIQATDYNGLASTNTANVAYVWGVGSGTWGYGQSTSLINTVSSGGTVTAVQWAGLVYTVNNALAHQGQSQIGGGTGGANINMTAGQTITYFSNVSTAVTQIGTTRATAYAQGSTTSGGNYATVVSFTDTSGGAQTLTITRTITFSGGPDAARYFFNAGGQINVVVNTPTASNGTSHSADFVTLWGTNLTGITIKATTTSYSGSGGTVNVNNTGLGYWNMSTSNQIVAEITSTNATYVYDSDYVYIGVKTNGKQGSNSDNGTVITVTFFLNCATVGGNSHFNNTVGFTHNAQINVVYPETTYLTNSWGTVAIT